MLRCMRTTPSIHDALLHKAKQGSAQRNVFVGELVEEGFRVTLAARPKTGRGAVRLLKTFRGEGVQPGCYQQAARRESKAA